jgi:hypothetical protein
MGPSRLDEMAVDWFDYHSPISRLMGRKWQSQWTTMDGGKLAKQNSFESFFNYGDGGGSESYSQRIRFILPTCNDRGAGFLDILFVSLAQSMYCSCERSEQQWPGTNKYKF